MAQYQATLIADAHCACGEIPTWDAARRQLLWTDIPQGRLYRWHQDTGNYERFYDGPIVGGILLQADDSLLLFGENDVRRMNAEGSIDTLIEDFDAAAGRFNECIADPEGRIYCGTMGKDGSGGLYRINTDASYSKICGGTNCANGMAFSPDMTTFYWTDSSPARTIYKFDYEQMTGELTERRAWLQFQPADGTPDGLTIDVDGGLWVAFHGGSCVRHFSAAGEVLDVIPLPVKRITSCQWGGDALRELFITSSGGEDGSDTHDGALFHARVEAQGLPEFRSRLLLD